MTPEQQAEALEVARALANADPYAICTLGEYDVTCEYCGAPMQRRLLRDDGDELPHRADCPWVRARKLVDAIDKETDNDA